MNLREATDACREYEFGSLITTPDGNAKLSKDRRYYNCGISLAPANLSGWEVCFGRTAACTELCLGFTGQAEGLSSITGFRIGRTKMFFEDRDLFMEVLRAQLHEVDRRAKRMGVRVAFRPNILSDLPWHNLAPWMFEEFSHWKFYGYTKVRSYVRAFVNGKLPKNYHLTFSWSERLRISDVKKLLSQNVNVAVPFFDAETLRPFIPRKWNGFRVINGDKSDLRFMDARGVVVGLSTKLPKERSKADDAVRSANGFFVGV